MNAQATLITEPEEPQEHSLVLTKPDSLAISRPPEVVLEEARRAATALADVIGNKKKKVMFNGEQYLEYEDWQTVARFYGVTVAVRNTSFVEFEEAKGFEAKADALLVSSNQVISSADAMCLNDEPNWARKPLFQLRSMAQTRACAKALRNCLAWVVVLAGYKPTPAEEMESVIPNSGNQYVQPVERKSQQPTTNDLKAQKKVTEPQIKRLFAIASSRNVPKEDIERLCHEVYKAESCKDLNMRDYDAVVQWVESK